MHQDRLVTFGFCQPDRAAFTPEAKWDKTHSLVYKLDGSIWEELGEGIFTNAKSPAAQPAEGE